MMKFFVIGKVDLKERQHVFPLLKPFYKNDSFNDEQRKKLYHISSKDASIVDNSKDSDCCILAMSWDYYKKHNQIKTILKNLTTISSSKICWSFIWGDYGVKIPKLNNHIVFRQSGNLTSLPNYHKGLPVFINDPLKKFYKSSDLLFNKFQETPLIGFCGLTNSSKTNAFKEILGSFVHNIKTFTGIHNFTYRKIQSTTYLRSKVISRIKPSALLQNNFIERKKYRAGAVTPAQRKNTALEFYNNIKNTDYTVCIRGAGNFSVRFYETLAMGRIPIFINTDCLLPLANTIDWKKHVVWIEENEIEQLEQKVLAFHQQFSPKAFKNLQESNRKLWKEQLTLGGFFKTEFITINAF
ncbi:MAG: exostosin domain-containing protein [Flavobacteriales bacterium]